MINILMGVFRALTISGCHYDNHGIKRKCDERSTRIKKCQYPNEFCIECISLGKQHCNTMRALSPGLALNQPVLL